MASSGPTGTASVKRPRCVFRQLRLIFFLSLPMMPIASCPRVAAAQAVPYARTFAKSREEVDKALKDLQAYVGQKLPIVDGFVASGNQPLNRYERAFYQFSIDLLPGASNGTIVRLTAKITAWYADPDPSKSGYQVLPSNGRLELDLLDRLTEKVGGKPSGFGPHSNVQAPEPKIDLSTGLPGSALPSGKSSATTTAIPPGTPPKAETSDEVGALRAKREAEEKRMQELSAELQSLQEIEHNQAHPLNLVAVKRTGTPLMARASEDSRVLFHAAAGDEFEFLDAEGDWIHVQISGASRGYMRRISLELPEVIAARLKSANAGTSGEKQDAFHVQREETGTFPGVWEALRGKLVKIYTVQPASQNPEENGPREKAGFALTVFQKFSKGSDPAGAAAEGVVVIFDAADGGIVGSTVLNVQQLASGSLTPGEFWKRCYVDPPEAFETKSKP
jgi:hypothetical protein